MYVTNRKIRNEIQNKNRSYHSSAWVTHRKPFKELKELINRQVKMNEKMNHKISNMNETNYKLDNIKFKDML